MTETRPPYGRFYYPCRWCGLPTPHGPEACILELRRQRDEWKQAARKAEARCEAWANEMVLALNQWLDMTTDIMDERLKRIRDEPRP